mgnify:CR=1 FL=1
MICSFFPKEKEMEKLQAVVLKQQVGVFPSNELTHNISFKNIIN